MLFSAGHFIVFVCYLGKVAINEVSVFQVYSFHKVSYWITRS